MKKRRINYLKYFSLFFAIAVLVFIAGCAGAPPTVPITNSVTYNGNGHTAGTVPVDPASPYESGATVTVLGNTGGLTRINDGGTSYYFTGWNPKADCSGVFQAEGSTFIMGESHVILYAQWKPYTLRDTGSAGGHIFYDKGGYSDGWRYLEAAPVSTEWLSKAWGSWGATTGATEEDIGTGQSNTTKIVTWLDNNSDDTYGDVTNKTDRAAYLCDTLVEGGYADWFLPSMDELTYIYLNLKKNFNVGGFATVNYYWSSSEDVVNNELARIINFNTFSGYHFNKNLTYLVRAVRAF